MKKDWIKKCRKKFCKLRGYKRLLAWILIISILLATLPVTTFKVGCSLISDIPDDFMVTLGSQKAPDGYEGYLRSEDSTYLTIPEWYTVFSYREYADFIAKNKQSDFPYFSAVGQFWYSYCNAYEAVKPFYPVNIGNHLMLSVIGVSYSVEFLLKGIYENTIGRLTEWISGYDTAEDKYAYAVAKEYADFVPFRPFYEFSFGKKALDVWTDLPFFGRSFIRKFERKLQISISNGVQAIYAWMITIGTGAVYGAPDEKVYMTVARDYSAENPIDIMETMDLPHYQGFTDGAPLLAEQGFNFLDIAGNDEIVISLIASDEWDKAALESESYLQVVFMMDVLSMPENNRIFAKVMVKDLANLLRVIAERRDIGQWDIELEHIFDY